MCVRVRACAGAAGSLHTYINTYPRELTCAERRQRRGPKPSPGVYFWPYPVFEAVRYGKIQLDTYGYSWIQQWNMAGNSRYAVKLG